MPEQQPGMEPASTSAMQRLYRDYGRILRAVPGKHRAIVLLLLAGNIAGAALEVLALWLLGTLISFITPGAAHTPAGMAAVLGTGPDATARLLVITTIAFLGKNLFMAALAWVEATFAFSLHSRIADKALAGLLAMDYAAVARRPGSGYLTLLTSDLNLFIQHYVLPSLTVVSETLLMLAVVSYLLWLQPPLTMALLVSVGGAGWLAVHWSRRLMTGAAQRRQSLEDERMRRLREIVGHLREVYVYRAGDHARDQLYKGLGELTGVYRLFQLMASGPRFALEFVLVAVLMSAIVFGLRYDERHTLIVSIGIFAAAGFRLLVGANRLIMSMQGIRFARPAMLRIFEILDSTDWDHALRQPAQRGPVQGAPRVLSLRAVEYRYDPSAPAILRHVDLDIPRGNLVGITGGSGAGKTTLLEVVSGLRQPTAGDVCCDGTRLRDTQEFFGLVSYAGQSPAVFSDTIRGNVAFGATNRSADDGKVWQALEAAHLAEFVRSLPGQLDAMLGEGAGLSLSGGQVQRLALARALYADCPFLILDEPTSALDPATEAEVVSTFQEIARDRGVLLVSHRPGPLQSCDAVYDMCEGTLRRV